MSTGEEPLLVEVIAYAPTAFYHCTHCEVAFREMGMSNTVQHEQLQSSLPADLAQDYQQLSDWVRDLLQAYCDQVVVQVIDSASIEGVIKSIRYRVRKFPAIIVDRQARFQNGNFTAAAGEVQRLVERRLAQTEETKRA